MTAATNTDSVRGQSRAGGGPLWAVTCYFNPVGYRRRGANYRLFRERLAVPLVTVELSCGGGDAAFELGEGDADVLVQLRGRDVLWQKERLLDVALRSLPDSCRKVAWLDCDILFGKEDWPDRAERRLDDVPLIQLFARQHHMPPDWAPGDPANAPGYVFSERSFASAMADDLSPSDFSSRSGVRGAGNVAKGVAWAARRELIERHGFFDACIVGGGDSAMACAAYGHFDHVARRQAMNERQREYYLAWALPYFGAVRGATSFLDTDVFHLWHGDMVNRRYRDRFEGMRPFGFDPFTDVAVDDGGCWRWSSDKSTLHQYVRDYFASRNEDGGGGGSSSELASATSGVSGRM